MKKPSAVRVVLIACLVVEVLVFSSACENDEPNAEASSGGEGSPFVVSTPGFPVPNNVSLAWSTSNEPLLDAGVTLTITEHEVLVDGEIIVPVVDNAIPESLRISASSPVIPALQQAVEDTLRDEERWDSVRQVIQERVATLIVDHATSYQVLTSVTLTASAGGVQQFVFVTRDCRDGAAAAFAVNYPQNTRGETISDGLYEELSSTPHVMIAISEDGFRIIDMQQTPVFAESGLGNPIARCAAEPDGASGPVTICLNERASGDLLNRLSFRELYNQLAQIRSYPAWADRWADCHPVLNIRADREIPFEVIVRTADVGRLLLERDAYENEVEFDRAGHRIESGQPTALFPRTVLFLPRSPSDRFSTDQTQEGFPTQQTHASDTAAEVVQQPRPDFCGQSLPVDPGWLAAQPICPSLWERRFAHEIMRRAMESDGTGFSIDAPGGSGM